MSTNEPVSSAMFWGWREAAQQLLLLRQRPGGSANKKRKKPKKKKLLELRELSEPRHVSRGPTRDQTLQSWIDERSSDLQKQALQHGWMLIPLTESWLDQNLSRWYRGGYNAPEPLRMIWGQEWPENNEPYEGKIYKLDYEENRTPQYQLDLDARGMYGTKEWERFNEGEFSTQTGPESSPDFNPFDVFVTGSGADPVFVADKINEGEETETIDLTNPTMTTTTTESVTRIQGPVSLREYMIRVSPARSSSTESQIESIHLYLFGDIHLRLIVECPDDGEEEEKQKTMIISNFIDELLREKRDRTIDLFIESPHTGLSEKLSSANIKWHKGYLFGDIRHKFQACTRKYSSSTSDECRLMFPNLRFHNVDVRTWIRQLMNYGRIRDTINIMILLLGNYIDRDLVDKNNILNRIRNQLKSLREWETIYHQKGRVFQLQEVIKGTRIQKQLDQIPVRSIREAVQRWMRDRLQQSLPGLSEFLKFVKSHASTWPHNRKLVLQMLQQLNHIYQTEKSYFTIWQDFYTLARLFRTFHSSPSSKNDDDLRGVENESISNQHIQNVIMYVGERHARQMDDFFRNYLSDRTTLVHMTENRKGQCLNITAFQRPFFSSK